MGRAGAVVKAWAPAGGLSWGRDGASASAPPALPSLLRSPHPTLQLHVRCIFAPPWGPESPRCSHLVTPSWTRAPRRSSPTAFPISRGKWHQESDKRGPPFSCVCVSGRGGPSQTSTTATSFSRGRVCPRTPSPPQEDIEGSWGGMWSLLG